MKKKLHEGAKWLFRIRSYGVVFFLLVFLGIFGFSASGFIFAFLFGGSSIFLTFFMGIIILIVGTIVISEIYSRMAYNRWFYEIGTDNIRLERGVITKRYSNIPYERVQNVDINRGIIARMMGFSSLQIQTAGYSSYGRQGAQAEGNIPALGPAEAEHIREFVLKKVKGKKSGL